METDFINQFHRSWRVFANIVNDFSADAWLHTGRKNYTPARLSLHLLQSARYYLEDKEAIILPSGIAFTDKCWIIAEEDLPTQDELLGLIKIFKDKTDAWFGGHDLNEKNDAFDWTGTTNFGIALFMFQHFLFHLGELASLLNESKDGDATDHYARG
jgi:hypothetical protein